MKEYGGVSYKEVLTQPEQSTMHQFLSQIRSTYDKAKEMGLSKPNVNELVDEWREIYFPKPRDRDQEVRRARKRAKGECLYCSNKVIPGMRVCPECREKRRVYINGRNTEKKVKIY